MSTPNDAYFDARGARARRLRRARHRRHPGALLHRLSARSRPRQSRRISTAGTTRSSRPAPTGCRRYGEYLGRRFGRFANIIWCIGGDWHPELTRAGLDAIAHGIRSTGVKNLFTAHPHPGILADRILPGRRLARRQHHLYLRHGPSLAARRLAARSRLALLPASNRPMRASTTPASCRSAGRPIGRCSAAATAIAWAIIRSGCSGTAGRRRSTCRARWPWRAGAASSARCPGASSIPDLERKLVIGGLGEARGLDRVTAAMTARRPARRRLSAGAPARRSAARRLAGAAARRRMVRAGERPARLRRHLAAEGAVTLAPPFEEDAVLTLTSRA